jgi:hypothetical protein
LSVTAGAAVTFAPTSGEITLTTNTGTEVSTAVHGGGMELTDPFVNDSTVRLVTQNGNLTVSGDGPTSATVTSLNGPTEVEDVALNGNSMTLRPPDAPALTVSGTPDNLTYFGTPAIDDGNADLRYAGSSGDTTVTFRGLQPDTTVSVVDTQNSQLLAVADTDAQGTLTVTVPNSEHVIELQSGDNTAEPVLSGLNPRDEVSESPVQVSVDVADGDFGSADESVDVELSVDGSVVATQTLTSPGTVSTTVSGLSGGEHTVSATAEDSFGNTDSVSGTFGVPSELTVRNESNATQTLSTAEATFSFVGNDTVVSRTADGNGNVSLSGLPLDRPVIVQVNATDYQERTYYFESLTERHTAYLLPAAASTSTVVYKLDDQTGVFDPPQETALFIKKPITTADGDTRYVTVIADRFDAAGELAVELETGARYRLQVRAPTGEVRSIGNYNVVGDDPDAVLSIGSVQLRGDTADGVGFGAALTEQAGNRVVQYRYTDPDDSTEELYVTIYETGNQSNVLLANASVASGAGTVTESVNLPNSADEDIAYTVEYYADRGDAAGASGERLVGDVPEIAQQLGIAPNVLSMLGWGLLLGSIGLVVLVDVGVSLVVGAGMATLLTWIGALAIPAPLLGIAGGIAVLTNFARTRT